MEIRETELPGIGHKFSVRTEAGRRVTVVIHNAGPRELCVFEDEAEEPTCTARLTDEEGRTLGAILGGAYYEPVGAARIEAVLDQITFHWHEVEGPPLAGRTIGELEIRRRTGASVIARLRADEPAVTNPGPEMEIAAGDTLILIGSRRQVEAFRDFAGA